ncbi:MAG: hypothetical protein IKV93_03435 [Alphaproteobacteria bacterium]|nr:hypothetical protein [Alphaproteobacteria bacterium]
MRIFPILLSVSMLTACNSVYMQPNSMERESVVYSTKGGYTLRPVVKEIMAQRGYTVKIGKIKNTNQIAETMGQEFEAIENPSDAKYIVRVAESSEKFRPIWCALNGFWWWRFNMSIVDNESDQEILTWSGRGCASSTARLFERILNELEK